jgi:hypothetical protein
VKPEPTEPAPSAPSGEAAADSSAASSTSERHSGSPYAAGPGPGFDPRTPPPEPPSAPGEEDLAAFAPGWEVEQVSDWLLNAGDLAHAAFGVGETDWAMTQADLKRIAPPATRILNRFEPTRAVAAYSDPAAVAIGFGMYGWRSAIERTAVLRARARAEAEAAGRPPFGPAPEPAPNAGPEPSFEGPAVAPGYETAAQRLARTRPPPEG